MEEVVDDVSVMECRRGINSMTQLQFLLHGSIPECKRSISLFNLGEFVMKYFCRVDDRRIAFMPYFQAELLSEILTIANDGRRRGLLLGVTRKVYA